MTGIARADDRQAIQALRPETVHTYTIATATSKNSVAFASEWKVVRISVSTDCYWRAGDQATITVSAANGHFLGAGQYEYVHLGPTETGIAIIRLDTDGTGTVSECA